ncbi:hypothetical protein Droror1_Dr00015961 [Drosera rotundifolia]
MNQRDNRRRPILNNNLNYQVPKGQSSVDALRRETKAGMKNMTVVEEKSPRNQGLASTDQILFKSWQQRERNRRRKVNTLEQDTIVFIRLTWKISVLTHFRLAAA